MRAVFFALAVLSVVTVQAVLSASQMSQVQEHLMAIKQQGASAAMVETLQQVVSSGSGVDGVLKLLKDMSRKYQELMNALPVGQIDCTNVQFKNDPYCLTLDAIVLQDARIKEVQLKVKSLNQKVEESTFKKSKIQRELHSIKAELDFKKAELSKAKRKYQEDKDICDKSSKVDAEERDNAKNLLRVLKQMRHLLNNNPTGQQLVEMSSKLRAEALQSQSKTVRILLETAALAMHESEHNADTEHEHQDVKKDGKVLRKVINQLIAALESSISKKSKDCSALLNGLMRIVEGLRAERNDLRNARDDKIAAFEKAQSKLQKRRELLAIMNRILKGLLAGRAALKPSEPQRNDSKINEYKQIIDFIQKLIDMLESGKKDASSPVIKVLDAVQVRQGKETRGQWVPSGWSSCDNGVSKRTVNCFRGDNNEWRDCDAKTRPRLEKAC